MLSSGGRGRGSTLVRIRNNNRGYPFFSINTRDDNKQLNEGTRNAFRFHPIKHSCRFRDYFFKGTGVE